MNCELKEFVEVYKKEFRTWEHNKKLPDKSCETIIAAYHTLNAGDREWVIRMAIKDLKYAFTNHTSVQEDYALVQLQKKKMIELKIFIVKFLVVTFGGTLAFFGSIYVLSELIHIATGPGDFLENFSKYIRILVS